MKLTDIFLENALKAVLNGDETEKVIKSSVELVHDFLSKRFGTDSNELEVVFMNRVLLPVCYELCKDNKTQFLVDLDNFRKEVLTK